MICRSSFRNFFFFFFLILIEYIKKHGTIEKIIANLDKTKYQVPDNFPYVEIREYFKNPTATPAEEIDV